MKDREFTRLLQTHPEEGLEAAMLAYAPLVKAVLNRILPQNPCDREDGCQNNTTATATAKIAIINTAPAAISFTTFTTGLYPGEIWSAKASKPVFTISNAIINPNTVNKTA